MDNIFENNRFCPNCGRDVNPEIRSAETGFSYCCYECARIHVNENRKEGKENDSTMKNITINIPYIYDKNLLRLKNQGLISSRSEGVRKAIKTFFEDQKVELGILGWNE